MKKTKKKLKYLVTTSNWFLAPDGRSYKGAWGTIEIFQDSLLGIKTNRNSTNWYVKVGNGDKHVFIAGCQIPYAIACSKKPSTKLGYAWQEPERDKSISREYTTPTRIYIAED